MAIGDGQATQTGVPAGDPGVAPGSTPAPAVSPAPGVGGDPGASGQVATPAPAAVDYEDIRDFAAANGLDLSHLNDSREAAAYLIRLARDNNAYAELGRRYAPHYQRIDQLLSGAGPQGQPAAPAPGAASPKNPFGLPEFDPSWMNMVRKDPVTGDYVPVQGAPPDIVHRVTNYAMQLQAAQQRFWQNPMQFLGDLIDERVKPMLEQRVASTLQVGQNQAEAQRFIAENTGWLHRYDQNGQLLLDPISKQPLLSQDGEKFVGLLNEAARLGISNQGQQIAYATRILRAETGGTPGNASNPAFASAVAAGNRSVQDYLQTHNRRPNAAGQMTPRPAGALPPSAGREGLSLREKLKMDLDAGGVTDAQIAAEV